MGDRYFLTVVCSECGGRDDGVYYAPTCGFVDWKCRCCGVVTDLEKYTGISTDECSTLEEMRELFPLPQKDNG